ncbi:MAG: hypothetical protein HY290_04745 [Planctomycetia bacterium]|nr:hypothetical protein [Planctomycetia bacterium]
MALITNNSCCAICCQQLGTSPIFGTWGVFLPQDDPLVRFCDAPIHWSCYANWSERERFARAYFAFWIEHEKTNPYWARIFVDDEVFVTIGPAVSEVSIRLAATGSDIRVPQAEWECWLEGAALDDAELQSMERDAIRAVLPRLKSAIPSIKRAAESVDWNAKHSLINSQGWERQNRTYEEYNARCREGYRRIEQDGLSCPHCGRDSQDFRFLDVDEERKSYFVCRNCARSFGPDDLK